MIDQTLLSLIVCPQTKQPLIYQNDQSELWSIDAKLAYPISNGIPVLLPDQARVLSTEEIESQQ